jgi:molybdate transport system ATP-binding protein
LKPERGHVRIGGETMFDSTSRIDVPARERRLGYVFQDYALFAHLTVRQNVSFGLAKGWRNPPRKGFRDSRDERVDAWLARLELDPFGDRYPEQLSGGQRQRTALARALVGEPRAILLDEPFSALDVGLRARLRDELVELQGRLSVPMILITHDPDDARVFAEATIAIESGRVIPSP